MKPLNMRDAIPPYIISDNLPSGKNTCQTFQRVERMRPKYPNDCNLLT